MFASDVPEWLQNYKNGKQNKNKQLVYFIGISSVLQEGQEKKAYAQARIDGRSQIANYINSSINSSLQMQTEDNEGALSQSNKTVINVASAMDLNGFNTSGEYILQENDGIVAYVLFEINKKELQKKKDKYTADTLKYDRYMFQLTEAMRVNDLTQAQTSINKIKLFKRYKSDEHFLKLLKKMKNIFKVNVTSNISLNKKFKLNEQVNITLRPTTGVYIYVLLQYGNTKKIKLIFPKEDQDNYILNSSKSTLKIHTKREYIARQANKIRIYASRTPIPFEDYINDQRALINSQDARWKQMLQDKIDTTNIYQKELKYYVAAKKKKMKIICLQLEGRGYMSSKMMKESKSMLKKHFKVKKSCKNVDYKVIIEYEEELEYNSVLEMKVRKISYEYYARQDEEELYDSGLIETEVYANAPRGKVFKEMKNGVRAILKEISTMQKEN